MAFDIDLSSKIVLITGVSSGIGAGIARMYAKAGAQIAGCALEPNPHPHVQQFRESVLTESGREALYVQADVTRLTDLEALVAATVARFGRIDVLASNAGANVFSGADQCTPDEWRHNLNLNLESHWQLARLCKPYLEASGEGVIVINSSCHAFSSLPGCFPYNIAKTALKALVQSLTLEWAPAIRTVGVAPGFIDTDLTRVYFDTFPDPAAEQRKTEHRFPMKRLGTPADIGAWFVFLSSPFGSYASGQTYLIDGGKAAVMMDD
ncbi:SDR family NAD(P)-dependent oxidoreductase [Fibrella aquatilis]|uniref:SDR family oxidoreductase n=1 Tax=Fibrella aquatilis TaxID=2817059 RepID=A0A939JYE0_9BACT|nr:SDR family oxidoreductase [Fibrella aquatilis]MBO0931989.1 SDR family oxidoreductase [Fibrella aquatilis]